MAYQDGDPTELLRAGSQVFRKLLCLSGLVDDPVDRQNERPPECNYVYLALGAGSLLLSFQVYRPHSRSPLSALHSVLLASFSAPFSACGLSLVLCNMYRLPTSLLALIGTVLATESSASCATSSLPNPIASQYYANITGTINGTLAVLPIPYSMARRIIPSQYEILIDQYQSMMPEFPKDMYPALLQAVFDHDIRYMEYNMPDFSVSFDPSSTYP